MRWTTCAGLTDRRRGADCTYTMADVGLAAFSVFFMQSPSFLAHQEALAAGGGRSNCLTLFGMEKIPCDNHIRKLLDGIAPVAFEGLFLKALAVAAAADKLEGFRRLGGRLLVALDGTEHFRSGKIHCPSCSQQLRADGKPDYFHSFLGATVVAPGHARVLPLPPEFITPQDGSEKQDCERAAAKRWLARHGATLAPYRPVYLGDDLYACQPVAEAIRASRGSFILTCKPSSHKTISEYLDGAELASHCEVVRQPGKKSSFTYRWLTNVPMRDSKDALIVNWFSVEIQDGKGRTTYRNSFITDLPVSAETIAELVACGRARWKIESAPQAHTRRRFRMN